MGVPVALAVAEVCRTGVVAVTKMRRNHPRFAGADIGRSRAECGGDGVGLRRGGQVHGGVCERQLRLGHSDQRHSLGGRGGYRQRCGVGHADVLTGQDQQTTRHKARILPRYQHPGQVVQGRVHIRAADRLDEGADDVVVLVAVSVVPYRRLVQ